MRPQAPHESSSRRLTLAAVLALVAGLLAVGGTPASATHDLPPAVNGPIAFVAQSDIWYRSAEGTYHQVTHGMTSPAWDLEMSPDGRRIAFSIPSSEGIWVVNLNGTNMRNVLAGYSAVSGHRGHDPAWDSSGHRLAFTVYSRKTGNTELFSVNVDKPNSLKQLTQWGAGPLAVPAWNPLPGSDEIAYIPCQSICVSRIKIINAVTLQERFVSAPDDPPATNLDWSADGTKLAVEAYSDSRLYTVNTDGSNWVYLDPDYARSLAAPSWSPDGSMIAVNGFDSVTKSNAVMLVNPVTGVRGGVTNLTGDWGPSEFSPTWGPACVEQCIGTELTSKARKRAAKLKVAGVLKPGISGQKVDVTLYRLVRKTWKPVASKRPTTNLKGKYSASFKRPKSGKCGVLAEFTGSQDHMPSYKAVPPFKC